MESMETGIAKPAVATTAAAKREQRKYVVVQASLRVLTCLATAIAALVMGLNKQSSSIVGFDMKASIHSDPTFEFFVIGNAIMAGYAVFSLIFLHSKMKKQYLHILDLVALCLLVAAVSSSTAIGYLGKYGNTQIGWSSVCSYYERFCSRTTISVALSYISMLLFISACAYRTKEINPTTTVI